MRQREALRGDFRRLDITAFPVWLNWGVIERYVLGATRGARWHTTPTRGTDKERGIAKPQLMNDRVFGRDVDS